MSGGLAVVCALFAACALALTSQEADQLLHDADGVKSSDPTQFAQLLQQLDSDSTLSQAQQQYLSYLKGWQFAYAGDYARAVPLLQSIIDRVGRRHAAVPRNGDGRKRAGGGDAVRRSVLAARLAPRAAARGRRQGCAPAGHGGRGISLQPGRRVRPQPQLRRPDRERGSVEPRRLPQLSHAAGSAVSQRPAARRSGAVLQWHRYVRADRRAAASERDAHVHRALVPRGGPQSRRHRAAEPVLRRNARLALSTRDLRLRIDPGGRLPQQRRPDRGARSSRCARSATSAARASTSSRS